MSRKGIFLAVVVLVVAAVAVIVYMAQAGRSGALDQALLAPRWALTELTLDGNVVELGTARPTLQFEAGGQAGGNGGCNSYSGPYQTGAGGKLSFGPFVSTEMACDALSVESAYFQALAKVEKFSVEGSKLKLSSTDGKTVLVFEGQAR